MLFLAAAVLASTIAASPAPASPASPVATVSAGLPTHRTAAMSGHAPSTDKKRPTLELPAWAHQLTVGQQQEAMRAELDAEFNVDHSP
jgi:hypothetical protein